MTKIEYVFHELNTYWTLNDIYEYEYEWMNDKYFYYSLDISHST